MKLSWDERWKRDGAKWRQIYVLENEIRIRDAKLKASLLLNAILLAMLVWSWA